MWYIILVRLRVALTRHPDIHCGPEIKITEWLLAAYSRWPKLPGLRRAVQHLFVGLMGGKSKKILCDKTPHNVLHTNTLADLFPRGQAKVLHLIRDGRAVTASLMRQKWKAG